MKRSGWIGIVTRVQTPDRARQLIDFWTGGWRSMVFALAATSIASLLIEFTGWCSMGRFTLVVFLPALAMLLALGVADRAAGTQRLWPALLAGALAGLCAAVAYDVFRLPFVFARTWGIERVVPALKLFKVFPRFGAMILGQPLEQSHYSAAAEVVGWSYHFSNGLTFGIMYVTLIGRPFGRHWVWGAVFAVGLELGMLFTPYPSLFSIPVTSTFVVVTLAAHLLFGVVLGKAAPPWWRWLSGRTASNPGTAPPGMASLGNL